MNEYTLSQQYALVGLDGQDSIHTTTAKSAVCRGIAAAKLLERLILSDHLDLEAVKEELEAELKRFAVSAGRKPTVWRLRWRKY